MQSRDSRCLPAHTIWIQSMVGRKCGLRARNSLWKKEVPASPAKRIGCRKLGGAQSLKTESCKKTYRAIPHLLRAGLFWAVPITVGACGGIQQGNQSMSIGHTLNHKGLETRIHALLVHGVKKPVQMQINGGKRFHFPPLLFRLF